MRATRRRRPQRHEILDPSGADLNGLANRVVYVGSPEHKDIPSFAGQPRLRADASCCPREIVELGQKVVCGWLRSAIRRGAIGAPWEGGFPRYVWYKDDGTVFEGRLVNRELGSYKGYPLNKNEWPRGIEKKYATT